MLTKIDATGLIYDLRKKIQQIQADLNQLGDLVSEILSVTTIPHFPQNNSPVF